MASSASPHQWMYACLQIVIDSIAALPRTEGVSKREEENFALQQVLVISRTPHQSCATRALAFPR